MNNYNMDSYGSQALDTRVSQVMKRVYVKMFLALIVTGGAAWVCAGIPDLMYFLAMNMSTPAIDTIHSSVLLAQNMFITLAIIRPIRAMNRNEPILVRSRLVK